MRQFADEKEAKQEADAAARRLHEGELQVLQLRDADKPVYVEALKMIQLQAFVLPCGPVPRLNASISRRGIR